MNCVLIYDIIDRLYTHINYLAPKTVMEIILTLRYFGINGQHHSDKASKQNAVNILRETYGFKRVVGFGDNLNDLPMFAECDIKVAPRNAKPEFVLSDFFKVTFRRNAPEVSIDRQSAVNQPQLMPNGIDNGTDKPHSSVFTSFFPKDRTKSSAAACKSFTLIKLSHASSFPNKFIPPCQTRERSITAKHSIS